jgi:hypothetical protein
MIARMSHHKALSGQALSSRALSSRALPRPAIVMAVLALGIGLSGCAGTSISDMKDDLSLDSATLAFVDPAKYDFYDCKQLETERKGIANHLDDSKRLMDKADTGFAGPVVAELVYRNDYIASLGQKKLADQAWRRNKCHETLPDPLAATAASNTKGKGDHGPSRAGNAVY